MKFRCYMILAVMLMITGSSFGKADESTDLNDRKNWSVVRRARANSIEWIARSCGKDGFEPTEIKGSKTGLSKVGKTALALSNLCTSRRSYRACPELNIGDKKILPNLTNAARWLLQQVDAKSGKVPISPVNKLTPYEFTLTAYALSEIYGMTRLPEFKPVLDKMIRQLTSTQNSDGGWSTAKGQPSSVSLTFWNALAIKCAICSGITGDSGSTINCVKQLNKFLISAIDDSGLSSEHVGRDQKTRVHAYAAAYALALLGEGRHAKVELVKKQLFKRIMTTAPSRYIQELRESISANQTNYLLHEWSIVAGLVLNLDEIKRARIWRSRFLHPAISATQHDIFIEGSATGYWREDQVDQIDLSLFNFKAIIIRGRYMPLYARKFEIMEEETGLFEDVEDDNLLD